MATRPPIRPPEAEKYSTIFGQNLKGNVFMFRTRLRVFQAQDKREQQWAIALNDNLKGKSFEQDNTPTTISMNSLKAWSYCLCLSLTSIWGFFSFCCSVSPTRGRRCWVGLWSLCGATWRGCRSGWCRSYGVRGTGGRLRGKICAEFCTLLICTCAKRKKL